MDSSSICENQYDRSALVLYGSETGNSEDVAYSLGNMLERLHFTTRISEMNCIEINDLIKYSLVILTVSTTGQGEFPRNARKFWKSLLRKSLPKDCLNGMKFTSFGLGDSSYSQFNYSARKLHKRLLQLGAKELFPAGEADERHPEGNDGTFLSWSHELREHLLILFGLPIGFSPIPLEVLLPPKHYLVIDHELIQKRSLTKNFDLNEDHSNLICSLNIGADTEPSINGFKKSFEAEKSGIQKIKSQDCILDRNLEEANAGAHNSELNKHIHLPNGYRASLKSNVRMTPEDHFQDVRELIFTIEDSIPYEPGDSIIIYPKNNPDAVGRLINIMGWQTIADKPLNFHPDHPSYCGDEWLSIAVPHLHPVSHSTLRQLLINNLDITAIPKRQFFEVIAHYTENPTHKERLLELANPIFTDDFYDYTTRPRRSILEVLEDFSSVQLPWQYATSIFPVIRGRAYSIASAGTQEDVTKSSKFTHVTILIAVVKYKTILRKIRQGLCSQYLASLELGTTIEIEIYRSKSFYNHARIHPQTPLILVCAGTGIAPCRSLILTRKNLQFHFNLLKRDINIGNHHLFFGGRNRKADFFYEDDWKKKIMRTTVYPAFSRDQREKIYVQDTILEESELVRNLILHHGAIIYVCGSSGSMPKAVKEAFISVLLSWNLNSSVLKESPMTRELAQKRIDEMIRTGRYVQETW
ncbi:NADPH-dependent diflavin oxidoreductase 1 [Erysiphe necator]|nr:NADPH-dependent diflavin oxidoreductase 1 [Erysiphe necator]